MKPGCLSVCVPTVFVNLSMISLVKGGHIWSNLSSSQISVILLKGIAFSVVTFLLRASATTFVAPLSYCM